MAVKKIIDGIKGKVKKILHIKMIISVVNK